MKKLLSLAVLALAFSLLTGCSGGGGEEKEKDLKGTVQSTEIQSAPGDMRPGGDSGDGGK
ncbi:MAG: hypothetical protein JNJ45_11685 [Chthonomonas sp.]|nr:hypothetical protein [Chthonomonas sp.]